MWCRYRNCYQCFLVHNNKWLKDSREDFNVFSAVFYVIKFWDSSSFHFSECNCRRGSQPLREWLYLCWLPRVRVSCGHLCEAETLTEPAGETVSHYKLYVLFSGCWIVGWLKIQVRSCLFHVGYRNRVLHQSMLSFLWNQVRT